MAKPLREDLSVESRSQGGVRKYERLGGTVPVTYSPDAEEQAVEEFGDGFLKRLVHALWEEKETVDEMRAEELLADALGPGGLTWLRSRPEF